MFEQRQTKNFRQAGLTTIALIYHMTVYKLRRGERNAVAGLMMVVLRGLIMVSVFYLIFFVIGIRSSPIRGSMIVYIMSGIFMFMSHNMAIQQIMTAEGPVSPLMKHAPMNTIIALLAAAFSVLYNQFLAAAVLLLMANTFIEPLNIEYLVPCIGMFILAWFTGCCIGLLFRALQPWWPKGVAMISQLYRRLNMITSGKMVVANTLPPMMLNMFDWNPLFHVIDQTRGYAFVNYTPHNSSLTYPIYAGLVLMMLGLMGDFVNRDKVSLSWSAGR
ncbi:ABC-type polysaccharide/polyol phosphate export permease [Paracoccus isoporae]|uniref:ABC-type polysaccharide/polyol phosphate export permease n=1 Tax=Paracoccus isoporae TaxID=591205 RepID=A0A1G6Z6V4_9RHOB|nr:ABC transporter [Paracoccus isoporae]SDD97556.1 ABC-type polysaccharide/polyol phosphate export permease [Paracoccus isoporae]